MTQRQLPNLAGVVRTAPIVLPQLLALLALVVLCAPEGGYPLDQWGPAAVLIELLLLVALVALPTCALRPRLSRAAILGIAGLTIWSALSISWADDPGAAAIATTRTALLAASFTLFARWRQPASTALMVVGAATLGLGVLAWGTTLQLLSVQDLDPWFLYDRLLEPVGYVNAGAAFWGITALLGTGLAGGRIGAGWRLLGAGVAVPAAALSLLCLSRGGLLSAAAVIVLILALLPGRARNAGGLLVAGLPLATALPKLLDVGDAVRTSPDAAATVHAAMGRTLVATVTALLLTGAWILIDRRLATDAPVRSRAARIGAGLLAALAAIAVLSVVTGAGPVTPSSIQRATKSITSIEYQPVGAGTSRLGAGLSSGRWQFWTVAWDQFTAHPWRGAGADNFREQFLLTGKGTESPAYPHSLELRILGQLGLVGGALLLLWLAPVLIAIRRLAAAPDPASRAIATAIAGAVGLWLVHGSVDWLLEYGGLTAIVGALGGLAIAAAPGTARLPRTSPGRTTILRRTELAVGAAFLLLAATWTSTQWVAARDRSAALSIATDQPTRAIHKAEEAKNLDPFGTSGDLVLGQLAIQRGDLTVATAAFTRAFNEHRTATAPRLWLGIITSAQGDEKNAKRWLRRAHRTAPRDGFIIGLQQRVAGGEVLNPQAVLTELLTLRASLTADPDPQPAATAP